MLDSLRALVSWQPLFGKTCRIYYIFTNIRGDGFSLRRAKKRFHHAETIPRCQDTRVSNARQAVAPQAALRFARQRYLARLASTLGPNGKSSIARCPIVRLGGHDGSATNRHATTVLASETRIHWFSRRSGVPLAADLNYVREQYIYPRVPNGIRLFDALHKKHKYLICGFAEIDASATTATVRITQRVWVLDWSERSDDFVFGMHPPQTNKQSRYPRLDSRKLAPLPPSQGNLPQAPIFAA